MTKPVSDPNISNPRETAAYQTDLHGSENKDWRTAGLDSPLLAHGPAQTFKIPTQAEVTTLSGIPRFDPTIVVFYFHKTANKIYVRIHAPGERLNIVDRPATKEDATKFSKQFQAYKYSDEGVNQVSNGTPLSDVFQHSPSLVAQLNARGIETTQQAANLSDNAIEEIADLGGLEIVKKCSEFEDRNSVPVLKSQNEKLQAEVSKLTQQLSELTPRKPRPTW